MKTAIALAYLLVVAPVAGHAKQGYLSDRVVKALFHGAKPATPGAGSWDLQADDLAPWASQAVGGIPRRPYVYVGVVAPWRYGLTDSEIAVARVSLSVGCGPVGPSGFIVGLVGSDGKLIARSRELFSEGSHLGAWMAISVDTAAYKISDAERAFGVRIVHALHDTHYCFADQVLHLYRVVGEEIVRILTTDVFYEQFDQIDLANKEVRTDDEEDQMVKDPDCSCDKRCPPKARTATLRMLPTATNGFYDIERSLKGAPKTVFRWNGKAYAPDHPDTTDHHVREEWDWCTGRRSLADRPRPSTPPSPVAGGAAKAPPAPVKSAQPQPPPARGQAASPLGTGQRHD